MLRAPRVSLATLCPLAQPEKAIGHESQIEPWLALTTPLLDASETDERRYASKMNLENRKNRGSSHQYMGWMSERISLRLPVAGEVFFLDIPFYRTMLHAPGAGEITIRQPQVITHSAQPTRNSVSQFAFLIVHRNPEKQAGECAPSVNSREFNLIASCRSRA